ncbi:hypothetical protein OIY81_1372 [Cryptosporidium canis]|nr:hypothetical protein OIY81_1372 [Cryptosporidium canis]
MSQYNYVVTAYESGSYKGVLRVDLFGDGVNRLVAIKARSMDIYEINGDISLEDVNLIDDEILDIPVLRNVGSVEVYKDVVEVDKWRPKGQSFDDIMILTRDNELVLLRAFLLDSGSEKVLYMSILDQVSLYRENLRKSPLVRMLVHPEKNRVVVLAYEGCLQVVMCEFSSKEEGRMTMFMTPTVLRLSELAITDICLVGTTNERTLLGILYDSGYSDDPRLMKVVDLPVDLRKWSYNTNVGQVIQNDIFKITPLYYRSKRQRTVRGFFFFGDGVVEYRTIEDIMPSKQKGSGSNASSQRIKARFNCSAFSGMDIGLSPLSITDVLSLDDGSRWLALDTLGRLFIMQVKFDPNNMDRVVDIRVDLLKRYSPFSRIVDLGNDMFFMASKLSDSLLIWVKDNKFYTLMSIPNIGPVRDLLLLDLHKKRDLRYDAPLQRISKRSPSPLVVACGFGSQGTLKSIYNGIGLQNLYFTDEPFVGRVTEVFPLGDPSYQVILTGTDFSECYKMVWNCEKSNGEDALMDDPQDGTLDKENSDRPGGKSTAVCSTRRYFISMEVSQLQGLEKDEETIGVCGLKGSSMYQVTSSGLHPIGDGKSGGERWLLRDHLPPMESPDQEYIERFEFSPETGVVIILTGSGMLLCYRLEDEAALRLVDYKTKAELFELTSGTPEPSSPSEEIKDLNSEMEILGGSIPSAMDEVCILGLHSVEGCILLFLGTWMNGGKLSCLCLEDAKDSHFELLMNIETEFRDYETMITSLRVFDLERVAESSKQRNREEEFVGLVIGTNNGHLQLQYISKNALKKLVKKKQRHGKTKEPEEASRFVHYNTWKVSESHISGIQELEIPNDANRHFFICCDQPKVLLCSQNSIRGRSGLGVWSFLNIHSSLIPTICQVRLPPNPWKKQELGHRDESASKACVLYVSHEEHDTNEIQIEELAYQDQEGSGIRVSRKTAQQRFLKLGLIDTLQRYNCRTFPLEFTPEKVCFVSDLNMYAVVGVREKSGSKSTILQPIGGASEVEGSGNESDIIEDPVFVESVVCLISAKDMKMHCFQIMDSNAYPTCVEYVTLRASNNEDDVRSFLAIGTSKVEARSGRRSSSNSEVENHGRVSLFTIVNRSNSYDLVESAVYETEVAPFVIKEFMMSQLLISIENSLICLEMHTFKSPIGLSSSSSSSSSGIWLDAGADSDWAKVELRTREAYCTHTMIVFIRIWNDEYLLVGDLMRSVGLWEFDKYTGRFNEISRDNALAWVVDGLFLSKNMYLISDDNQNLRILMQDMDPENDEVNTSLSCIGHIHVGESAATFQRGRFNQAYPETRKSSGGQDCMDENPENFMYDEQVAFGTSQGSIYLVFSIKDDQRIFSQLALIEEAIISAIRNSNAGMKLRTKVHKLEEQDLKKLFIRSSHSTFFSGVVGVVGGKEYTPLRWELSNTKESYNFEYDCSGIPRGFISGDIVEMFLELPVALQESVLEELHSFNYKKRLRLPEDVGQLETLIEQFKNMH